MADVIDQAAGVVTELAPPGAAREIPGRELAVVAPAGLFALAFLVPPGVGKVLMKLGVAATPLAAWAELAAWRGLDQAQRRRGVALLALYAVVVLSRRR
ncbi:MULTISPECIES: hypothetical protein [Lentzea]|uniref:Uncharacterized protein n=1 Tax=Lentzea albida TaxID=65499 RepID=A0A1H9TX81_9PSEU|nr:MULTISPECIES: hypothetical protein [Lentzea]USX48835.1 hypothetical protein ND450_25615 [Lentzea sp. HUAS12]SES01652.1 hypothetical protein SAMN04488000_114239 [Lentzea albida]